MGQALHPTFAAAGGDSAAAAIPAIPAIPGLWRGLDLARPPRPGFATGFALLDAELPGGGWPAGALTEVLHADTGIGELRLFFHDLKALTGAGAPVFLLDPPWIPYAPALANAGIALPRLTIVRPRRPQDALWACEQILKGLGEGALVAWPHGLKNQDARRLQLAVEGKPVLAVLMRPLSAATEQTPAALRIALEAAPDRLVLRILKRRGGLLPRPTVLAPHSPLPPALDPPPHVVDRDSPRQPAAGLHPASAHA